MGSSWQSFSVPIPPERGAFPLDLQKSCKKLVDAYVACIKTTGADRRSRSSTTATEQSKTSIDPTCRELSKAYLKCRMDHGLMERDKLENLGFQN